MTRKSWPLGAAPYSAALISLSVPSTPTRSTLTRTPRPFGTSDSDGFASSARCTLFGWPGMTAIAFMGFSTLLKQLGDERGPAGLVAGADGRTRVAVEVLVERNQVVPVRIGLEERVAAEHRTPTLSVLEEDPREPLRQLGCHVGERQHPARPGRTFDAVLVAEVMV